MYSLGRALLWALTVEGVSREKGHINLKNGVSLGRAGCILFSIMNFHLLILEVEAVKSVQYSRSGWLGSR